MVLSTAEAVDMAVASAVQEAVWLQHLVSDLNQTSVEPTVIYVDNQSTICMAKNLLYHRRAKYVEIKFHFIREQVAIRVIQLQFRQSKDMVADVLTKGLTCVQFVKLRELLGVKTLIQFNYLTVSEEW